MVKELLENALDAGAKTIRIEVEVGGKRMIRVIDDGHGMMHDDALLAFERHATSKLRSADDLLSIATLGFRGEALPTIAAVSRLLLETRDEAEAEGTRIEFAGGKLVGVKPAGLPAGTTVSVADLFYCVPARRKFLKSDTTELGHIASLVTHYALANPGKQFVLDDADARNHKLSRPRNTWPTACINFSAGNRWTNWSRFPRFRPRFARPSPSRSWNPKKKKRR